jgi:hypothetical protein
VRNCTTRARSAVATVVALLALAGCDAPRPAATGPTPTERSTTMTPPPGATPEPTAAAEPASDGTPVLLTVDGTTVPGVLWDNPGARALAARLPVTLTLRDHGGLEKTGRLDPPLDMAGMPAGDDPGPGEIGWYAPSSDLVLYYGDVGYWTGISRLGTFDTTAIDLLADGPDQVTVTLAPADS